MMSVNGKKNEWNVLARVIRTFSPSHIATSTSNSISARPTLGSRAPVLPEMLCFKESLVSYPKRGQFWRRKIGSDSYSSEMAKSHSQQWFLSPNRTCVLHKINNRRLYHVHAHLDLHIQIRRPVRSLRAALDIFRTGAVTAKAGEAENTEEIHHYCEYMPFTINSHPEDRRTRQGRI